MRLLICGSRDYSNKYQFELAMNIFISKFGKINLIIHGNAKGADTLAKNYAISTNTPQIYFPAKWEMHGKAAGMIRNRQMLIEGKPDIVIAFPGGKGTANMIKIAQQNNVECYIWEDE